MLRRRTNAQETFKALMRDEIAPALRQLGFKGSGQAYALPSETCWALVGFQKSQASEASYVRFTVNATVVSREAWEQERAERPYLPERPSPNTFYGKFAWQERIGGLMPGGQDRWWEITGRTDARAIAESVIEAIRDYALPAMHDEMRRVG